MYPQSMAFAPRILLTGFEPFGKAKVNPTEKIVQEIHDHLPDASNEYITTQVLPVTSEASRIVNSILPQKFDYVVHLGLNMNIDDFALEMIGINIDDYRIPDNQGDQVMDRPIDPDGENAYFVSLPVREFEKALQKHDIPYHTSYSAGTYLCNHLLYTTLNFIAKQNLKTKAGFIHVPPLEKIDLENMMSGILIVLETLGLDID